MSAKVVRAKNRLTIFMRQILKCVSYLRNIETNNEKFIIILVIKTHKLGVNTYYIQRDIFTKKNYYNAHLFPRLEQEVYLGHCLQALTEVKLKFNV